MKLYKTLWSVFNLFIFSTIFPTTFPAVKTTSGDLRDGISAYSGSFCLKPNLVSIETLSRSISKDILSTTITILSLINPRSDVRFREESGIGEIYPAAKSLGFFPTYIFDLFKRRMYAYNIT